MTALERAWRGGRNDWRLHVLGVFSVAVAFVCMASALLVVFNVDALRDAWARAGRASVYLVPGTGGEQVQEIEQAMRATPGVRAVRYVSSEDARRELTNGLRDDVLDRLPETAFPASLEITLAADVEPAALEALARQLTELPAVDAVETYRAWTDRLAALLAGGVTAAVLLAVVVLGAVTSVVASTIRLSLQRRRIEVEVLKLVGATDEYVLRPFVIEGAVQGGVGAALALALVLVLYGIVRSQLDGGLALLVGVSPRFLPLYAVTSMIFLGAVLGAVAAHASLRKLLVA